eukprot:14045000-Ditylum_brightwellii.AAC.2
MMDIIGCNITCWYEQQDMNNVNNMKDMGTKPSPYNIETRIIKANCFKIGSLLEAHNALQESMGLADPYKVFNLTDEMMHIDKETLSLARSLCNWLAVYKMKHRDTTSSEGFHGFITEATETAPVHNKCLSKAIPMAVLPDGTLPSFNDDAVVNQHVDNISRAILAL